MTDQLGALTTIFTEFYYWITVVLMFLIHVGFCMYEVGASRYKHHQHTLMKIYRLWQIKLCKKNPIQTLKIK